MSRRAVEDDWVEVSGKVLRGSSLAVLIQPVDGERSDAQWIPRSVQGDDDIFMLKSWKAGELGWPL